MDRFRHDHLNSDYSIAHGDNRLKEDLADAMRESPIGTTTATTIPTTKEGKFAKKILMFT